MSLPVGHNDEQKLLDGARKVAALVADGQSPDEATLKVAQDGRFGPGGIRLLAAAYNTGEQLAQWHGQKDILDKLASFPLVDAEAVIGKLYPEQVDTPAEHEAKTAVDEDYLKVPRFLQKSLDRTPVVKLASDEASLPPVNPPEPSWAMKKSWARVDKAKLAMDESRRLARCAVEHLEIKMAELRDYFRKFAYDRLPFNVVETLARANHGAAVAAPLLDHVYQGSSCRDKRAQEDFVLEQHVDLRQEPFPLIAACIKAASAAYDAGLEAERTRLYHAGVVQEVGHGLPPFSLSQDTNPPGRDVIILGFASTMDKAGSLEEEFTTPPSSSSYLLPEFFAEAEEKAAGILGTPAVGSAVGTFLGRTIGGLPKTKDDLVDDAQLEIEDPEHQNEIRKIKAQAMLNSMMTDPDDPISGHDPDTVLSAYNEIAAMAPRLAEQPAALKPVLRRKLQGNVQPFEAKEVIDLEKGLLQSRSPSNSNQVGMSS